MTGNSRMSALANLIPHRAGAVLLDEIIQVDQASLTAALTVRPGTAFSDMEGNLPGWTGPELMAQAVAAFAGERSLRERGYLAPVGLLLGIRGYESVAVAFRADARLTVEAVRSSEDEEGRGVFDCRILEAGNVLATGTLTVFQPNDWSFLAAEIETSG